MRRPFRGSAPEAARIVTSRGRTGGTRRVEVAGVAISHPDRVFYPDVGVTKLEVARYYEAVAAQVVPQVRGRPLTLVRCPETIETCAYMRHLRAWGPSALRRVMIEEKTKRGEYLVADDLAGVISLVQMDILEIHTWNAVIEDVERPDRIVMDLDPGEGVPWTKVAAAARRLRVLLDERGLASFVKSTGGKGLHVVVPLTPEAGWDACLRFARALGETLAREDPAAYTTQMSKALRKGRIYIDYLRNSRGNSAVAAWSTRARPSAPVSTPLGWNELSNPPRHTVRSIPARLARLKRDPWAGYARVRQTLPPSA
jgi:bifunctional non-homologous end joining protein LigD